MLIANPRLTRILKEFEVLERPQTWYPPIEEMVAIPLSGENSDGRIFVTNRNDDSLSIVDLAGSDAASSAVSRESVEPTGR